MKQPEMKAILEDHRLWIESDGKQGKRANLRGAKFATNFKKVGWFECATFSKDQIPWVVLNPRYPKWADTLKWVKVKADAA